MFIREKKGQSILEYAILMGLIVAVIVAIQVYVKRAYQERLKASADQIGGQFTANEDFTIQTIQQTARKAKTIVDLDVEKDKVWSESKIQTNAEYDNWAKTQLGEYVKKAGDYKGAEISVTDYVSGVSGADETPDLGTHAAFDSGKLSDKKLFDDD
jgi:Flp pilus assembly pilin Flp